MEALDNPVWHALTGPQETVAERVGNAVRYQPDFTVFSGLPLDPSDQDWADLATLQADQTALLIPVPEPGPGWDCLGRFPVHQMVLDGAPRHRAGSPEAEVLDITSARAELDALVLGAEPGPWNPRTAELGTFVGIRIDGRLVATAGRRMHVEGAIEISAVCAHADVRGQGLGAAVTAAAAAMITAEGQLPFLHVRADNEAAVATYRSVGFAVRRDFEPGVYVRAPRA